MSDEKQPVQYYDLKAARASGISDEDILNQLAQTHNYDLAGAREHGVSDSDILSTLIATKPPAEPVIEKESPEIMGGIGATAGVLGAAGDVIYSKGRPLIRMAEKAMGREPSTPLPKQRAFLDPSAVAEQAIARRTAPSVDVTGSPSAVRNWGVSQHEGEFLGGKEYSEADKIKKEALAFEKANPGQKVMPGSLLAIPEHEARNLAQKRAELAAQEDALKQAEVQAVAQKRAERLGERSALKQQQTKYDVAKGTAGLLGKAVLPIVGGYQLGSQGAQAYNRLTRPDLTARDVLSGATNVVGAGTGALSMVPSKYRIPAAIASQAAGTLANMLDKRNPRDEIVEEKAAGGSIQGYADGGNVTPDVYSILNMLGVQMPQNYAAGGSIPSYEDLLHIGLMHFANGGDVSIPKNNPMFEQAAQKALTEIAKRKALYEIHQIAEQQRALNIANNTKTSSVSPSIMPADSGVQRPVQQPKAGTVGGGLQNVEPSGNGGPTLNNPLNR